MNRKAAPALRSFLWEKAQNIDCNRRKRFDHMIDNDVVVDQARTQFDSSGNGWLRGQEPKEQETPDYDHRWLPKSSLNFQSCSQSPDAVDDEDKLLDVNNRK